MEHILNIILHYKILVQIVQDALPSQPLLLAFGLPLFWPLDNVLYLYFTYVIQVFEKDLIMEVKS